MKARPNPKLLGERAECIFLAEAVRRELTVSKPYGDSAPYDFIVDPAPGESFPPTLWRVQVKSTSNGHGGGYFVGTRHHSSTDALVREEADFLAVLVVPLEVWYIIPVQCVEPKRSLWVYPAVPRSRAMFEKFRAAWHLLKRRTALGN